MALAFGLRSVAGASLRSLHPRPGKLSVTALSRPFNGGGGKTTPTSHRSARPRARIRAVTEESDLSDDQLNDLFAGQFPTNCADEVIHLSNLSQCDFRRIVDAFDTSRSE